MRQMSIFGGMRCVAAVLMTTAIFFGSAIGDDAAPLIAPAKLSPRSVQGCTVQRDTFVANFNHVVNELSLGKFIGQYATTGPDQKTLTLDLGGDVKMELVRIEPGEFLMGSPANEEKRDDDETQHKVRIAKAFYMGIHEVTQGQYKAITGQSPSYFKGSDDLPVERVSWEDAVAFCQKLSKKTGRKIRLPTEAEWEYACRAGTTTPFSFGPTISTAEANYDGRTTYGNGVKGVDRAKTIPVGSLKKPNAWGLHDMHGNVWEWCSSKYTDYPYRTDDGREEETGKTSRVVRGGSWYDFPKNCRSAYRIRFTRDTRDCGLGFRVVLD